MPEPYERRTRINFGGQMVDAFEVEFSPLREDWNAYQLADGTRVRMKVVVASVFRIIDQYDAQGNPVYVVQSSNVLSVDSPGHLKKSP